MASIGYTTIYNNFLGSVTDYNFVSQSQSTVNELMCEYMHKMLAHPYVRRLFASLSFDDTNSILTYTLNKTTDDSSDQDFVVGMIVKGMVVEWIEPQVKKTSLMAQMFGGKELQWFSQASQLAEMRALLSDAKDDLRRMIRDRGFIYNPYLED